MIFRKKAITLIEISIGILIFSILLVGILNLFSSGLKGSAKALTHQDNMEAANLLMAQIENDLAKASEIVFPEWNKEARNAQWKYKADNTANETIFSYDYTEGDLKGVHRKVSGNNLELENYLAKDHIIDLKFKHFAIDAGKGKDDNFTEERHGIWVDLTVYSKDKNDKDSFTMKRLISIRKPF